MREVPYETLVMISNLREGDIIEVSNGGIKEEHTVRRVRRVKIETTYQGNPYLVPFSIVTQLVKKADQQQILQEKRQEFKTLKLGEPFWFKNKRDAVLLYFKEFKPGKIVGISPIDNVQWTIDESMYGGRIDLSKMLQQKAQ